MNKVYFNNKICKEYKNIEKVHLTIKGQNNEVYLNDFFGFGNIWIYIEGDNCVFRMGDNNRVDNDITFNFWSVNKGKPNGAKVIIGNDNVFHGSNNIFICPIDKKIQIGDRNLFAGDIYVWGRNDHIIYDNKTHKRLNNDEDIIIGNSNWICQRVTFLPKARLGNNSVLGYGSLLNRRIKENHVLVAGVPAKIVKEDINWSIASDYDSIDFNNNIILKENK